jgi:hypothetical protein
MVETKWWERLTPTEVFRAQAHALLAMPFSEFHRCAEEALGRPVWTHEFADMDRLLGEHDGAEPTPEDPAQHAVDSLAAMMLAQGNDPDRQMIVFRPPTPEEGE